MAAGRAVASVIKAWTALVFTAASTLSIKCCFDLVGVADRFPGWFVPTFVAGVVTLLSFSAVMMVQTWRKRDGICWANGAGATVVWFLIPLSFVCTSAVHGFYPFRPASMHATTRSTRGG